jgi:hypothetical protein
MLVIDELQAGHAPGNLWRHLRDIAIHEGIVRASKMPRMQPEDDPCCDNGDGYGNAEANQHQAPPACRLPVGPLLRFALPGRALAFSNGMEIVHAGAIRRRQRGGSPPA